MRESFGQSACVSPPSRRGTQIDANGLPSFWSPPSEVLRPPIDYSAGNKKKSPTGFARHRQAIGANSPDPSGASLRQEPTRPARAAAGLAQRPAGAHKNFIFSAWIARVTIRAPQKPKGFAPTAVERYLSHATITRKACKSVMAAEAAKAIAHICHIWSSPLRQLFGRKLAAQLPYKKSPHRAKTRQGGR